MYSATEFNAPHSGCLRSIREREIDKRLVSHAAFDFRWKPKQNALSCRLHFMGGIPEGSIVFGDNQFVTISPSGMARLLNRGEKR